MTKNIFRTITGSALCLALGPVAFAASNGASSAFGESVRLKILPILGLPITINSGPLPTVAGAAPPPYSTSNQVASASVSLGLLVTGGLHTGLLIVDAASNLPGSNNATADATVNSTTASITGLLGLSANVIRSSANSGGACGALTSTGLTSLANVTLNGIPLNAAPAPNTVVLDAGGIRVVINEQITTGNGSTDTGITVNAIHISLTEAPVGLDLISGDIIISQSKSSMHCTAGSADLAVVKTASPMLFSHVAGSITYQAQVTNQGPDPATGVVLSDMLPAGASFASVSTTQGACAGGSTVTCNLGSISPGGSVTVLIVANVVQHDLANTATVHGNEDDSNPGNNSSTVIPVVK